MMSQPNQMTDRSLFESVNESCEIDRAEFLAEIEATPPEHQPYLLKMMRAFRESVTQNLPISAKSKPQVKTTEILSPDLSLAETQGRREDGLGLREATLYTDGACQGNPGPGGYGIVLIRGDRREELSGGFQLTTNNRMEMMAAIVGLQVLEEKSKVTLYSDSKYVVDAIEKGWAEGWQANGWKRNKKEWAMNPDLWEQLLKLCSRHEVKFIWVKGHAGNRENECCDRLAVRASQGENLPPDIGYENPPVREIS